MEFIISRVSERDENVCPCVGAYLKTTNLPWWTIEINNLEEL